MIFQRQLIAGWKDAHRWGSIRLKALAAGLIGIQQAWPNIPEGWKSQLPAAVPHYLGYAAIASVGLAAYSQLTKAATKPAPKEPSP